MIGKSNYDYITIRLAISGFRGIAPASLIYLTACVLLFQRFILSRWLGIYALSEAVFYLLVYIPRRARLQKAALHPPPLDRLEREALFERCGNHLMTDDNYPSRWFTSPDIRRDNVIDWLLWALFSCERADAQEEWVEELDGYVLMVEKLLGRQLEPGHNVDTKCMRLTLDPVVMVHRPLIWYTIVGGVDIFIAFILFFRGFHHYATPGWFQSFPPRPLTMLSRPSADPDLPYWYRPHRSTTKLPILFIHGIGIGLYPYTPFFKDIIAQDPDVGILAIELLPISMHMTRPILSSASNCLAIARILSSLNIPRVVVVSHSYGTVFAAHMLHSPILASRIAASLFIDPIPFLLHLPNVAYNFVYRHPHTANEWQLWYFASRDADISRALSRYFFWAENVMWKEELEGKKVGVVLSGDDQIVHAEEVRKYLTGEEKMTERWEKNGLNVMFFPGLDHAMVFDTKKRRQPLLNAVHRFVQDV